MLDIAPRIINGKKDADLTLMFEDGRKIGEQVRNSGEELDTNFLADNHMVAMKKQGFRFRAVVELRDWWNAGYKAGFNGVYWANKEVRKCISCKQRPQWESVIGLCEPCYDELCKLNARIKTPDAEKVWKAIAPTLFR